MKKNLTELVFILDRSGSMSGLEADTVGGFNSMLRKQQREEGDAFVSTILFDNVSEVIHDRADIKSVRPMTERIMFPAAAPRFLMLSATRFNTSGISINMPARRMFPSIRFLSSQPTAWRTQAVGTALTK